MGGSVVRTAAIGVGSGLLAAYAMERVQAAIKTGHERTGDKLGPSGDKPSTEKAADVVAEIATGRPLPPEKKSDGGRVVHYVTAAGLGMRYGLLFRRAANVAGGFGVLFGFATSLFLDETIVPALGLSPPPNQTSLTGHLDGLAAHAVFGACLEGARRVLGFIIP